MLAYDDEKCRFDPPLTFFAARNRRKKSGENCEMYQWDVRSSRFQNEIESFLKRKSSRFQSVRTFDLIGGPGRTRTCNQTVMSGRL
jgi:hypothetical protein